MNSIQPANTCSRLFSHIKEFDDAIAIIDSTGQTFSYRTLVNLGSDLMRKIQTSPALIAIEACDGVYPLATYIGAVLAGHVVILAAKDAISASSRIQNIYQPNYTFSQGQNEWVVNENKTAPRHSLHKNLAVLLSTSGTTGNPKLVRLSHTNLNSNARSISSYLRLNSGEHACLTLPWSYSYGLSVINSHFTVGATVLLPSHSVNEQAFWDFFNHHKATSFAGVPYTFELLERSNFYSRHIPSLKYFTQAGGKLDPDKVIRNAEYAERNNIAFYVMYGQTEATARMAYMPPALLKSYPDYIGKPIPGGQFSLIDKQGNTIGEDNKPGELVYTGPNIMMGYATHPDDLAREPEIRKLHTGDIAVRNKIGLYKIVGRNNRFSKIFGLRINLDDVEELLAGAGIAARVAGDDRGLIIASSDSRNNNFIHEYVTKAFKLPPSAIMVWNLKNLPRLPSGKVDYPALLKTGRKHAQSNAPANVSMSLRDEIATLMGIDEVKDDDTFIGIGGDSLNYVEISMLLEKRLGRCPKGWELMTFKQLDDLPRIESFWLQLMNMDIFIRAVAILAVVFHHVSSLPMGGAATTLLIVSGYNFARFNIPKLISGEFLNVLKPALGTIIPFYYLILTLYFVASRSLFLPQYLLVSNFTDGFYINGSRVFTTFWFIESYLWLIFIFCMLFRSKRIRGFSVSKPWLLSLTILMAMLALRGVGLMLPDYNLFNSQTPLMTAYIFAIGWCIFTSKTTTQKLLVTLVTLLTLFYIYPTGSYVYIAAPILLLWVPSIPLEKWTSKLLSLIALASFYIYMTHGLVLHFLRDTMGLQVAPLFWPLVLTACILIGTLTWKITELLWLKSPIHKDKGLRQSAKLFVPTEK